MRILITLTAGLIVAGSARAAESVDYAQVQAVFKARCLVCHSGNVLKGELDLSTHAGLMKGGKRGAAVVPSKSAASLLIKLVRKEMKPSMPPRRAEPIQPEEINVLVKWIDGGAKPSANAGSTPIVEARPPAPAVRFVRAVAIGPDFVAAARANQVHLFDLKSGEPRHRLLDARLRERKQGSLEAAHVATVEALALGNDGKLLATGSFREAALWNPANGAIVHRLTGFADRVVALAFSPQGKLLAVGGGTPTVAGSIDLFDTASGERVASFPKAHSDTVLGLCFSPDGKQIASASADLTVKIHEVPSGKLVKSLEGHSHHALDVAWSQDGKFLASAGTDKQVRLWDVNKGEELKRVARGGGKISIMSMAHDRPPCRVRFVGASHQLVTAGARQPVRLWLLEEVTKASNYYTPYFQPKQQKTFGDDSDYLYAVDVNEDGSLIASGGAAGVVYLYDAKKGELLHKLPARLVE